MAVRFPFEILSAAGKEDMGVINMQVVVVIIAGWIILLLWLVSGNRNNKVVKRKLFLHGFTIFLVLIKGFIINFSYVLSSFLKRRSA